NNMRKIHSSKKKKERMKKLLIALSLLTGMTTVNAETPNIVSTEESCVWLSKVAHATMTAQQLDTPRLQLANLLLTHKTINSVYAPMIKTMIEEAYQEPTGKTTSEINAVAQSFSKKWQAECYATFKDQV